MIVLTPNGKTSDVVRSFVATPGGEHQAWLFMRPCEKQAHAQDNTQAVRDARNKARRETETGKPARTSLTLIAEASGVGSVGLNMGTPLGIGPDREKTQKALSKIVRRAELSAEDKDAQTAWQKAYKQVKVSVSLPPPKKKHMCAEFPQPS